MIAFSRPSLKRVHTCGRKYRETIIEVGVPRERKIPLVSGVLRFLRRVMTEDPKNV